MARRRERGAHPLRARAPADDDALHQPPERDPAGHLVQPAPLGDSGDTRPVRLIGNILWFVLAGLPLAIGYLFAALVMFILIITIPFGLQAVKLAAFALWPFGRTVVKRPDAGAPSVI